MEDWIQNYTFRIRSGDITMEDDGIALNSVLGLELNRIFFAVSEPANKRKIIAFAREVLRCEQEIDDPSKDGPRSSPS